MLSKKLFLASPVLFVLASLSFIGSVGASSEMWSRTYGGASYETAQSVVETSDGGYALAGYSDDDGYGFYSDFWLVKTDSYGNMEWKQTYDRDDQDFAYSLVVTSDGGFAIAGYSGSDLAGRDAHFWLVKTDGYGKVEWNQTYGKGLACSLVVTSDGGFALAGGARLVKTDAYGNMEWNRTYGEGEIRSLVETSDGGYALAGSTTMNVWGYYSDFWLVKTDAYGNMEWNRTYGRIDEEWIRLSGDIYDRAHSLVETSDGGFAIAGNTGPGVLSGEDTWLVKTDEQGNMEWNQTYQSGAVFSLIVTSDEGFAMAGHTRSYGAVYDDFWLVKTDGYGNLEWNQTYGGTGFETAHSLVETSDGGYILAGDTNSFGAGYNDFWLVKTDAQGIPEFPSWVILPLLLTATLLILICKQRLPKTTN